LERTLCELDEREEKVAASERNLVDRRDEAAKLVQDAREKGLLEAQEIIAKARREVASLLDQARKEKAREAKDKLDQAAREVEEAIDSLHPEESVDPDAIAVGDVLFVKPLNCDATILSVDRRGDRVRVRAGSMELDVAMVSLLKPKGKEPKKVRKQRAKQEAEQTEAASSINLLGMRVEEAIGELEPFLNHASLERMSEVRVVHGKGTGALMKGVRNFLSDHPLVSSFRTGERFEGGDGVTVVTLR
jgi:DNA mismatch repair protein MutS2